MVVDRKRRDPVAPARASKSVRLEKKTHLTPEGLPVQSFRTVTQADAPQAEALRLIKM
jgi:hypothetical protein